MNIYLEEINKHWDSSGYLKCKPNMYLFADGGILDKVGKLAIGTYFGWLKDIVSNSEKIDTFEKIRNMYSIHYQKRIIPRVVCTPVEQNSSEWQKEIENTEIWEYYRTVSNCGIWYRTDVSFAQFTYTAIGMNLCESPLLIDMLFNINRNKFYIKNFKGETTKQGSFYNPFYYPFTTQGLMFNVVVKYMKINGICPNISKSTEGFLKMNIEFIKQILKNLSGDNLLNACLMLHILGYDIKEHLKRYEVKEEQGTINHLIELLLKEAII